MFGNIDDIKLNKLRVGFTFNLNREHWEITEVGEYSWNTGEMSTEYTIKNNTNTIAYLEVEIYKGEYEIYFSEEVFLDDTVLKSAIEAETIIYNDKEFYLEETYKGSYKNMTTRSSRERLENFIFYNKKQMITIEIWDDEMQVFYGETIKKKSIKKIKSN